MPDLRYGLYCIASSLSSKCRNTPQIEAYTPENVALLSDILWIVGLFVWGPLFDRTCWTCLNPPAAATGLYLWGQGELATWPLHKIAAWFPAWSPQWVSIIIWRMNKLLYRPMPCFVAVTFQACRHTCPVWVRLIIIIIIINVNLYSALSFKEPLMRWMR